MISAVLALLAVIGVSTQAEFDAMPSKVRAALDAGHKNVSVSIGEGVYRFRNGHLAFAGNSYPEASLSIKGNGAVLVSAGQYLADGATCKSLDPCAGFLTQDFSDYNPWSRTFLASGAIEVVDETTKLCRLKSSEVSLTDMKSCPSAAILVTQWFKRAVYDVVKVKDGWIYFTASDLARAGILGWNVNNDIAYGGKDCKPRFKLFGMPVDGCPYISRERVHLPSGTAALHMCESVYAFDFGDCSFGSIEISGLSFRGSRNSREGVALLRFSRVKCPSVRVHDCDFQGIRGYVASLNHGSSLEFYNNSVKDIYSGCIYAYEDGKGLIVTDNSFRDCGKGMNNNFVVKCAGDGYYIARNRFCNFGYGGISVGAWHKTTNPVRPSGVVERNELWYEGDVLAHPERHCLMDSGAIYLYTLNASADVRYNFIHDITGVKDNRGIFCDDGARNFNIHGNVVLRVANSYCIDSRREKASEDVNGPNNVGNQLSGNVVDGAVRFEGNEAVGGCSMGANYRLPSASGHRQADKIRNVGSRSRMTEISSPDDLRFRLSREYQQVKDYLK